MFLLLLTEDLVMCNLGFPIPLCAIYGKINFFPLLGFCGIHFFQLWIFASYDEDSIENKLEVFDSLLWYNVTVNLYAVSDVGCSVLIIYFGIWDLGLPLFSCGFQSGKEERWFWVNLFTFSMTETCCKIGSA